MWVELMMVTLMMSKGEEHEKGGMGKNAGYTVSLIWREVGRHMTLMAMLTMLLLMMMLMLIVVVGVADGTTGVDDDGEDKTG